MERHNHGVRFLTRCCELGSDAYFRQERLFDTVTIALVGKYTDLNVCNKSSGTLCLPGPSPTQISPTLTQSTSNSASNSSSSPTGPTTPPRQCQSHTRYGGLGRVPLHRRGTSKTYERLEDLLKEAGFKETRVFTPEDERAEETVALVF